MKTHQLQAGTYCVFPTAEECKAAFERARQLKIKTLGGSYGRIGLMVGLESGKLIACGEPRNKKKYRLIPHTEFLARLKGEWEQPKDVSVNLQRKYWEALLRGRKQYAPDLDYDIAEAMIKQQLNQQ